MYIAIEGVIGVGKTTLARFLQEALHGSLVQEIFEENPFLGMFYQDRERYAFQTQMFFLLSRYRQMRQLDELPRPLVSDYMFAKNSIFANLTMDGDELMIYQRIYDALAENLLKPDLIVYLRADTPTLMRRIELRDRSFERGMEEAYIESLRVAYEQFFAEYPREHVLRIDTNNLNYVQDEDARAEVVSRILSAVGAAPRQPSLPGLSLAPDVYLPPLLEEVPPKAIQPQSEDMMWSLVELQMQMGTLAGAVRDYGVALRDGHQGQAPALRKSLNTVLTDLFTLAASAGIDPAELLNGH